VCALSVVLISTKMELNGVLGACVDLVDYQKLLTADILDGSFRTLHDNKRVPTFFDKR
jgi:hypothetical protein